MKTVCLEPGCPTLVDNGGRCPTHGRPRPQRPNSHAMGYTRAWAKTRAAFLQAHPTCLDCGATATVADHAPHTRARLLELGVEDPDAWHRLQPRCAPCHGRKTVKHDGGFGREKVPLAGHAEQAPTPQTLPTGLAVPGSR